METPINYDSIRKIVTTKKQRFAHYDLHDDPAPKSQAHEKENNFYPMRAVDSVYLLLRKNRSVGYLPLRST